MSAFKIITKISAGGCIVIGSLVYYNKKHGGVPQLSEPLDKVSRFGKQMKENITKITDRVKGRNPPSSAPN